MYGSLIPVLAASAALVTALPSGNSGSGNSTGFGVLGERGIFGPIATDSAASIAGGQVACGAPPVSSFFAGLKPPVGCLSIRYIKAEIKSFCATVSHQLLVGAVRRSAGHRHGGWPLSL